MAIDFKAVTLKKKIGRLAMEPPFRLVARQFLRSFDVSAEVRDRWELSPRPHYFAGVRAAAVQARREGVDAITVAEFGVAGGAGLLALEWCARTVSDDMKVDINVVGFDTGAGLPGLCGDYRDHPDHWRPSDYPMDEAALRARLHPTTRLLIGNVEETVHKYVLGQDRPLGFASMDLDLYSSTRSALRVFAIPGRRLLRRCFLYFDDVDFEPNHRFAGELLSIDEFNADPTCQVRIDTWRGISNNRPFPERNWLRKMYVAHDLEAISSVTLHRDPSHQRCSLNS